MFAISLRPLSDYYVYCLHERYMYCMYGVAKFIPFSKLNNVILRIPFVSRSVDKKRMNEKKKCFRQAKLLHIKKLFRVVFFSFENGNFANTIVLYTQTEHCAIMKSIGELYKQICLNFFF